MCENFRKLILILCEKNCKIGAADCDKLNKIFIKHSHTSGGSEKNSHTCVKIQDKQHSYQPKRKVSIKDCTLRNLT